MVAMEMLVVRTRLAVSNVSVSLGMQEMDFYAVVSGDVLSHLD